MNPLQLVYGVVGIALAAGIGGYVWHCQTVTAEYAEFRRGVEAAGKKAQADADDRAAKEKIAKEKADEASNRDRARIADLSRRLRDARARGGILPPASPLASSPGRAAFDRAELERTLQRLDAGVSGLVAEGDAARVDLDTARRWAVTPHQR